MLDADLPTATKQHHASNQPFGVPVKEKYSPAAVSPQDTISMALSIPCPSRRCICTSERPKARAPPTAPSAASSCAAARPAGRNRQSSRIMRPTITVAIVIICSVISASGVRSCNAIDRASSINDEIQQHFEAQDVPRVRSSRL